MFSSDTIFWSTCGQSAFARRMPQDVATKQVMEPFMEQLCFRSFKGGTWHLIVSNRTLCLYALPLFDSGLWNKQFSVRDVTEKWNIG